MKRDQPTMKNGLPTHSPMITLGRGRPLDRRFTSALFTRLFFLLLLLPLVALATACNKAEGVRFAELNEKVPTIEESTETPTPKATATPTSTPTPASLDPSKIFDKISPSIAFVETAVGSGSGVLISDGFIVTNAHVVWPFPSVRVVFSDGSEYLDTPVINWDLLADLAVVGPISTDIPPVELVDGENLAIGSNVFLIGYPGEVDEFPKPTITRGLISRIRQWDAIDVTFFQTDAMIAGGQSGGVLVSEAGQVIGISGFTFSEADFGLVASATDIMPRIQALISNEDFDGLVRRRLPLVGGQAEQQALLRHEWDSQLFIVNQPVGTEVEVELDGFRDGAFILADAYGYVVAQSGEGLKGVKRASATIELDAPYFLEVFQEKETGQIFTVSSNHDLIPYKDPDDGKKVSAGQTIIANLDYPGDIDFFEARLRAGDMLNIYVDSILIDPFLLVGQPGDSEAQIVFDDDTGGGIFGSNAELTFKAPHDGTFLVIVQDSYGYNIGGYVLKVNTPYEGAPTPLAPPPTATPILSEFGEMALFESPTFPFSIEYPADWRDVKATGSPAGLCQLVTACFEGRGGLLAIAEEDVTSSGLGIYTLEQYVDFLLSAMQGTGEQIELISRESRETTQGLPAEVIVVKMLNGTVMLTRFTVFYKDIAFGATYIVPVDKYEDMLPVIEYSFNSFRVTELEK